MPQLGFFVFEGFKNLFSTSGNQYAPTVPEGKQTVCGNTVHSVCPDSGSETLSGSLFSLHCTQSPPSTQTVPPQIILSCSDAKQALSSHILNQGVKNTGVSKRSKYVSDVNTVCVFQRLIVQEVPCEGLRLNLLITGTLRC